MHPQDAPGTRPTAISHADVEDACLAERVNRKGDDVSVGA